MTCKYSKKIPAREIKLLSLSSDLNTLNVPCKGTLTSLFLELQELLQPFLMFWRYLHCTKEQDKKNQKQDMVQHIPL